MLSGFDVTSPPKGCHAIHGRTCLARGYGEHVCSLARAGMVRVVILGAMRKTSLQALAIQQLELAATHGGRPAADTVVGGHDRVLRQTVVGLLEGSELGEHNNPGEATVYVLHGRVRLLFGDKSWEGRTGDLIEMPDARHSLQALQDSAILLTVAKLP